MAHQERTDNLLMYMDNLRHKDPALAALAASPQEAANPTA
jgi:hypothetical protein